MASDSFSQNMMGPQDVAMSPHIVQGNVNEDQVLNIGRMAGRIWHELNINGDMSVSALVRRIGSPRDYVMEGIGWLSREGKISIHEEGRIRLVSLIKLRED